MLVDAHAHFWDPAKGLYPWMTSVDPVLAMEFGPDGMAPTVHELSVDSVVLAQARSSLDETRELLAVAAAWDWVGGVIGWVDLTAPDVADTIAWLRAGPGGQFLRAIRHQANEETDPHWLARDDVIKGTRAALDSGLAVDLLCWPRELPAALELLEALPDSRLVLDHLGKPPVDQHQGWKGSWTQLVRRAARHDSLMVKLCGLLYEAPPHLQNLDNFRPYLDIVLEAFGPNRLMFGSDWPVSVRSTSSYRLWLDMVFAVIDDLSPSEKASVLGGAADRFYRLGLEESTEATT